jgi:cytochrome c-type biogenesis protein CcmF
MAEFGHIAIVGALIIAVYTCIAGPLGARAGIPELVRSARNGALAVAGLLTAASAVLLAAFLAHDFSIRYVAEHSSRDMPRSLVAAAFYSGQQGSLLYWAWALSLFTALVTVQNWRRNLALMPYVTAVSMLVIAFFAVLLGFVASPFEKLAVPPAEGLGLNPLLYDAGMLYHPPMLLAGYMSWTIPFAFAIAALATGRLDAEWIRATRRYALVAWAVLGIGNLLGAWWAYRVLGWGGYWGWDPVENSAIMPWLVGTAFVHSIMIQERRGMLKVWNMALVMLTFFLCIFGTFIVRSGIINSVHSFAQSAIGPYFFGFLAFTIVGSLGLLFYRLPLLRSDNQLDSVLSREASFLVNNLLFLGLVFATFWGTIFPLISEALQGVKITVGPPYFNQVNGPIMLLLILAMGIGPLMPWRKTTPQLLLANLWAPMALGLITAGAALVLTGAPQPVALFGFFCCGFVLGTIAQELVRGTLARRRATGEGYPLALLSLVRRNNRRYGGYVVHLGVIVIGIAIIGSSYYQLEHQVTLRPGQAVEIGRYRLTFTGLEEVRDSGVRIVRAQLPVEAGGKLVEAIAPERRFHRNFERQPSTVVAIRTTPIEDLYVVLVGWESDGAASFLLFVNPLVVWLWAGGIIALLGTFIAIWPHPVPAMVRQTKPVTGFAVSRA